MLVNFTEIGLHDYLELKIANNQPALGLLTCFLTMKILAFLW